MGKGFVLLMAALLWVAMMGVADVVEVDVFTSSGYLEINAYHIHEGNVASHHWFEAIGPFTVEYSSRRNDGASSWYDELVTHIQASGPGPTSFEAIWFQDFNQTYHWGSDYTGEVGAYVFGTDGAEMNVGSGNFATYVSMDSYPAWSTPALMASGNHYELRSYAQVLEGPGDLEAYSEIYVFGSGGTAWQSFGYNMQASKGAVRHSGSCLGVIPPLGSVWGTTIYVDGGSGWYYRNVYGDDFVDCELGTLPGGGFFSLGGNFFDGMLAKPWTDAH
jgi:hypothetical protein